MHGHEGHAHEHNELQTETVQVDSCGSGCGCGSNEMQTQAQGGCGSGCGCSGGSTGFDQVETAVIQGFLSGLYASTLPREKLAEYLTVMSNAEGSPFKGPATMLSQALADTPADTTKPIGVALLETVTGEPV
jgi:hypothetical protein